MIIQVPLPMRRSRRHKHFNIHVCVLLYSTSTCTCYEEGLVTFLVDPIVHDIHTFIHHVYVYRQTFICMYITLYYTNKIPNSNFYIYFYIHDAPHPFLFSIHSSSFIPLLVLHISCRLFLKNQQSNRSRLLVPFLTFS